MTAAKVKVNRAPVLTLWASVVAERLGYEEDAALTLGKALAGLTAQSKGRRLGIYEPKPQAKATADRRVPAERATVHLMGREIPALNTPAGIRAADKDRPMDPDGVRRYLDGKFGDHLPDVRRAMQELAASRDPSTLAEEAYALYERFRPAIPRGTKGWGAPGELDPAKIRALSR